MTSVSPSEIVTPHVWLCISYTHVFTKVAKEAEEAFSNSRQGKQNNDNQQNKDTRTLTWQRLDPGTPRQTLEQEQTCTRMTAMSVSRVGLAIKDC